MRKEYMNVGEMASTRSTPDVYNPQPRVENIVPVFNKGRTMIDDDYFKVPSIHERQNTVNEPIRNRELLPVREVVVRPRIKKLVEEGERDCKMCSHLVTLNIVYMVVIGILFVILLLMVIRK